MAVCYPGATPYVFLKKGRVPIAVCYPFKLSRTCFWTEEGSYGYARPPPATPDFVISERSWRKEVLMANSKPLALSHIQNKKKILQWIATPLGYAVQVHRKRSKRFYGYWTGEKKRKILQILWTPLWTPSKNAILNRKKEKKDFLWILWTPSRNTINWTEMEETKILRTVEKETSSDIFYECVLCGTKTRIRRAIQKRERILPDEMLRIRLWLTPSRNAICQTSSKLWQE